MNAFPVKAWSERISIPTYGVGNPTKHPMFLEKRVYQGSSGAVYPFPVIESISDVKEEKEYTALFLENEWLKIMILPELGGRVQMALEKTNGYHFVYYNRVIKPALVGLCGPWISGGIEFNWPQHHRPSTFMPVQWKIDLNADGGATVWCSEIERMTRTQGTHSFTLHPGRAYLQIDVSIYNRTELPQSFLWWANPAVHVNDDYQSVFPPDVHAVMDHGKRAVSDFPIATGEYYKVNYAPGTDISRYRNIPVPTSFMAYHSDFDFIGSYDHEKRAGMLHVANHYLVPGKKQWTWGTSDFGKAWDAQLTDNDGPYIELMCGAFTDNQPDFTWLAPGEEKRFSQHFLPYKDIGPPVQANEDLLLSLSVQGLTARIGLYATSTVQCAISIKNATVNAGMKPHFFAVVDVSPSLAWSQEVDLSALSDPSRFTITATPLNDESLKPLIFYVAPPFKQDIPKPAAAARAPKDIASNDELYLNGIHLEQYRHATSYPRAYYEEALRRDEGDSRCNHAMGLIALRNGKFAFAESFFRRAIHRVTERNPNPQNGEHFYHLGIALRHQNRDAEAVDAFWKAAWSEPCKSSAYFEIARITHSADLLEEALARNYRHSGVHHLRIALLSRSNNREGAVRAIQSALDINPFNFGALYEQRLLGAENDFAGRIGSDPHAWIELSMDYQAAGMHKEALAILREAPQGSIMTLYYVAWIEDALSHCVGVSEALANAASQIRHIDFPNRVDCVPALAFAIENNPRDALAPYALGNFWYSRKQYDDAIACWETSCARDASFPGVWRNLGLAYMNHNQDSARARDAYMRACSLEPTDARVFYEFDSLEKKMNRAPSERLIGMESNAALVEQRDDLAIEQIALLNFEGRHGEALERLLGRRFHPWEGGEGKTTAAFTTSLIELAKLSILSGDPGSALELLDRSRAFPDSLGEGKLFGARENNIDFWAGVACEMKGNILQARTFFEKAGQGSVNPSSAQYYNDQPPDMIFYQALAIRAVGGEQRARAILQGLIDFGESSMAQTAAIDYFAVSLPDFLVFNDDIQKRHAVHCHYMTGLGRLGFAQWGLALAEFDKALTLQADHSGSRLHSRMDIFRKLFDSTLAANC